MLDELHDLVIDVYTKTPPTLQGVVLLALIAVIVWLLLRRRGLKLDLRQARLELTEKNVELKSTQAALGESQRLTDKLVERQGELEHQVGSLLAGSDGLQKQLVRSRRRLRRAREVLADMQLQMDRVVHGDSDVWCKRFSNGYVPPSFVPRHERRPRFVAVQNLKGGVGKTTLVANLGAAYATGVVGEPLRVLLVDLDFQGTLSNCCVEEVHLGYRRKNGLTSACLLGGQHEAVEILLDRLVAPLSDTEQRGGVIVANDDLDRSDFRHQACLVARDQEARFWHRDIFHSSALFARFDLVLFDCPPRLTTSSINALLAADYILIPTTLQPFDVEAVPRTLRWLNKLNEIDTFSAQLGGVIVNKTYHNQGHTDRLTADERRQLDVLKLLLREYDPGGAAVLQCAVRSCPEIGKSAAGSGHPFGAKSQGHDVFRGVAEELHKRIMQ